MNEHVKAFAFLRSFDETMDLLSDEDELALTRAIRRFVFQGEDPDFGDNATLKIAWTGIRPSLDVSVRRARGGANSRGARPSMRGNQNAKKAPAPDDEHKNNTESTLNQQPDNTETTDCNHDIILAPCSSLNNSSLNSGKEVQGPKEDWRHLSSVRKDMLGWNKDAIAEYKKGLLREEVEALGILTRLGVEAFVRKWGEHTPGNDSIKAEYEPVFNVSERAQNYVAIGRPAYDVAMPEPLQPDPRFEEGKSYWIKSFSQKELNEMGFEQRRHLQRRGAVKLVGGKWIID